MKRIGILLAVAIAVAPLVAADVPMKVSIFTGQILPLADVLKASGIELDRDASPHAVALVTAEGKVYPIIKDAGGRRFFKDPRLFKRTFEITGRLATGSELLQVISARSLVDGKARDLYYWCDICAIKRYELNDCECCGGPMLLKEDPIIRK